MRGYLFMLALATQLLLSFLLLLSVKLFSLGFIENWYFWFIVPMTLVVYIVSVFLSLEKKELTIGMLSSVFYFACLKLMVSLRYTDAINYEPYSYFYSSSVNSVLTLGRMDLEAISNIFESFAVHPPIITILSVIQLVTGLKFELIYTILPTLITPIVMMPTIYGFFRRFLELEKNEALLGLLLFNSNLLMLAPSYFGYGIYGYLLFFICLSFLGKTNRSSRAVFLMVCFVNAMAYSISSYSLIFFVLILFLLQKTKFFTNPIKLSLFDVLYPITATFAWMMYVAIIDLTVTINVTETLLGHVTSPKLVHESLATTFKIYDPYSYMVNFTYIGQGLIALLGFIGLIATLFFYRRRKNFVHIILWFLGVTILSFFALGVDWLGPGLVTISDFRYRFLLPLFLFVIPLTIFGFRIVKSNLYRILKGKISFVIVGIIISFILFSPIADNSSIFLRRSPISATEPIVAPHQWFQLARFISSFSDKEMIIYGTRSTLFLRSTGVVSSENVRTDVNPGVVIQKSRIQRYFLAFSRFNLYLPDLEWPVNEIIVTEGQLELINRGCSKLWDSGDVWLYYRV